MWCEKTNRVPVIYWGPKSLYRINSHGGDLDNGWEYFFYPTSNFSYNPNDQIYDKWYAPDGSRLPFCEETFHPTQDVLKSYDESFRRPIHDVFNKFIKIKPHIVEKINTFYQQHMQGKQTVGLHIRRTDKHKDAQKIPLSIFIDIAKKFQDYQYFVASDSEQVINDLKNHFGNKIIAYDAYRSKDNTPIHYSNPISNKIKAGEDVLIEAILLSKCNIFIHGCSNVATAVLFFNPTLKHVFLTQNKISYSSVPIN